MRHEIRLIDATAGLRELASGSVQMILVDPAYDTLEKWRNMGTTTRLAESTQSSNQWFPTVAPEYFPDFFGECYRVLAPDSYQFVMCDEETGDFVKPMLRAAGFKVRKSIVWHKVGKLEQVNCPRCGTHVIDRHTKGTPGMGYPFRSSVEYILLAEKGHRRAPDDKSVRNFLSIPEVEWLERATAFPDVVEVPWIKRSGAYPTEKPVALLEILIKQGSDEGDLILDPFAGSGSCGEAAFNLKRNFLGFDVEQAALDYFAKRRESWLYPEGDSEAPEVTDGVFDIFSL
jgi:site-specific DNA-methyltransferase (adenine-specific)